MTNRREGGCQCGALRYAIHGEPVAVVACHCTDCQRQSGSAFGMTMVVPREGFEWLSGSPKRWATRSDSGTDKDCIFCADCGTRIYHALGSLPKTFNVKPGTLDDTSGLDPVAQVWLSSRQPWVALPEKGARFERNPVRKPAS